MYSMREHNESHMRLGRQSFSSHQLVEETDRSWVMRPSGQTGISWVEIVYLRDGSLLVHGDIGPVIFSYGPRDPVACLSWVARSTDSLRYMAEKACIGTGSEVIIGTDVDVAEYDVRELLEALADEGSEDEREAMEDALNSFLGFSGDVDQLRRELYENCELEAETVCEIGKCYKTRLHFALCAVERLWSILEGREAAAHTQGG